MTGHESDHLIFEKSGLADAFRSIRRRADAIRAARETSREAKTAAQIRTGDENSDAHRAPRLSGGR